MPECISHQIKSRVFRTAQLPEGFLTCPTDSKAKAFRTFGFNNTKTFFETEISNAEVFTEFGFKTPRSFSNPRPQMTEVSSA
ncbi:hypothetical protein Nepgr_008076 [Nepenthes gracilis]|uniref:Uncharacterized protein n=1 Tax=Nepenthes gracilis TaxID=150966 RepID=A0AAD3S8E6_NEPGR|nr:hypothetical protein Nepgr_008076 [Nepenthes gracilis]